MKLSIFTTITNPEERQDLWDEAIKSYLDIADEVVIVNGGKEDERLRSWVRSNHRIINEIYDGNSLVNKLITVNYEWPENFTWDFIGKQFQRGYDACTGDWVIRADIDYIFHEKWIGKIKEKLEKYNDKPAVNFYKWQFLMVDRYNLKSRCPIAFNKAKYGDQIKLNGGGDLCQPTLNGVDITAESMPDVGIEFFNYECTAKTQEIMKNDFHRFAFAWDSYWQGRKGSWGGTSKELSWKFWQDMQRGRLNRPQKIIPLEEHPKYMQETIKNLKPEQFGRNCFGLAEYKNTYYEQDTSNSR